MNSLKPLRWIVPGMSPELLRMSLFRYSGEAYAIVKNNFFLDLLAGLIRLPAVICFLIYKAGLRTIPQKKVDVLLDCQSRPYYELFFKKIDDSLTGLSTLKAGSGPGMDIPQISNRFLMGEVLPAMIIMVILTPYILLLSIIYKLNLITAMSKTCVVYYRTSRYFSKYPCELFFTYADNICSPALYGGFKTAGGKSLCAFQNGLRAGDSGVDYSCFDNLFLLGRSGLEMYRGLGSMVNSYTEIGSLLLGANPSIEDQKMEIKYDVMFVDQGFPLPGVNLWGSAGSETVKTFLDFIRRFSMENHDLRMVYQLRKYDEDMKSHAVKLREWFLDTNMVLLTPKTSIDSCHTVAISTVIVTMWSTLGLLAFAMGKPALFFNFSGNNFYNFIAGELQSNDVSYGNFKRKIDLALQGKIGLKDVDVDKYVSKNSLKAPFIIAEQIKKELGIECH